MNFNEYNKKLFNSFYKNRKTVLPSKTWPTYELIKPILEGKRVLEIGCGIYPRSGKFAHYMDISEISVELLKNNNYKAFTGTMEKIPVKKESYEIITAFEVLEHTSDDIKSLKQVHKALVKDGIFIFSVPINEHLWTKLDEFGGHQYRYDYSQLLKKLEDNGFRPLRAQFEKISNPWFYKLSSNVLAILANTFKTQIFWCKTLFFKYFPMTKFKTLEWHRVSDLRLAKKSSNVTLICRKI